LGILGIENQKPNIFFLSFPAGNYQKIIIIINFFKIFFRAFVSARTHQPVRTGRVRGYRGRARVRGREVRTRLSPCGRMGTSAWSHQPVCANAFFLLWARVRDREVRTHGRVRAIASAHPCGRVFLLSVRMVKTRPRGKTSPRDKRGRTRTSGRNGRPDGKFYCRTSV
jgi:hypothetical protein